jgi:hypothetical protein
MVAGSGRVVSTDDVGVLRVGLNDGGEVRGPDTPQAGDVNAVCASIGRAEF